jgi:hypothetical protein
MAKLAAATPLELGPYPYGFWSCAGRGEEDGGGGGGVLAANLHLPYWRLHG